MLSYLLYNQDCDFSPFCDDFHFCSGCCSWHGITEQEVFLHLSHVLIACEDDQLVFKRDVDNPAQLKVCNDLALLDPGANFPAHISSHSINALTNRIMSLYNKMFRIPTYQLHISPSFITEKRGKAKKGRKKSFLLLSELVC